MVHLKELFSHEELEVQVAAGLVGRQLHADLPLAILNYTHQAQWEQAWNDVTLQCRGLIYNYRTGEVVARPFRKFFNWDQAQVGKIPIGPMIKAPKMDGSLGILYPTQGTFPAGRKPIVATGGLAIATRGSFVSDQAKAGSELLLTDVEGAWFQPDLTKTYLFEIIYPENRIVVDYKGWRGLVLLDVIDNETGRSDLAEFDDCDWPHKVTREARNSFSVDLVHEIGNDEEGFVLYWPFHDLRVKLKGPEYCRLHRILTGVSTKTIWQYLSENRPFDRLLEAVPDEFYQWVARTRDDLMQKYASTKAVMAAEYAHTLAQLPADHTRRDFAALACRSTHSGALFRMLDGKPVDDIIWKSLKPVATRPFRMDEDGGQETSEELATGDR